MVLDDGETATGQEDTSLLSGLAWLVWLLSWIGALVSVGVSIAMGIGQSRAGSDTPVG